MLFLVSFEVAFGPRWLQWKAMEHKHNVTRYRSKYETLVIAGADPGFMLGGGAPLRNDVTIQDFSQEGVHL